MILLSMVVATIRVPAALTAQSVMRKLFGLSLSVGSQGGSRKEWISLFRTTLLLLDELVELFDELLCEELFKELETLLDVPSDELNDEL